MDSWPSLYGWIPIRAYADGSALYFARGPTAFDAQQAVLAGIIAGIILVAVLPGSFLIPRKANSILETLPYVVVRS